MGLRVLCRNNRQLDKTLAIRACVDHVACTIMESFVITVAWAMIDAIEGLDINAQAVSFTD